MPSNILKLITGGTHNHVSEGGTVTFNQSFLTSPETTPGLEKLLARCARGATHDSGARYDAPKCHPDTRTAILDGLVEWATVIDTLYPIKWLYGPAGAGKSAIAQTFAEILFAQGILLATFFFFRSATTRNRTDRLICTIAYQLSQSLPATKPFIVQAIEGNEMVFDLSLEKQAQALILDPLLRVFNDPDAAGQMTPRVIILDGLDEAFSGGGPYHVAIRALSYVVQNSPIKIRLLAASRPEPEIRQGFDREELSSRVALDDSFNPDADIDKFLSDKFNDIRLHHPLRSYIPTPDSWPSQGIITMLRKKSSGQFIFPSTVAKFVGSVRHNPADRLDIICGLSPPGKDNPFKDLDALYSLVLSSASTSELKSILRVLGILLIVPLGLLGEDYDSSPSFLERLLSLRKGGIKLLFIDLESLLSVEDAEAPAQIFHASLADFLFDKSRSNDAHIDAGVVHADLAIECMNWLLKGHDSKLESFLFRHLGYHFEMASPTHELLKALSSLDITKMLELRRDDEELYRYGFWIYFPILMDAIQGLAHPTIQEVCKSHLVMYDKYLKSRLIPYFKAPRLIHLIVLSTANHLPYDLRLFMKKYFALDDKLIQFDIQEGLQFFLPFLKIEHLYAREISCLFDAFVFDPHRAGDYFIGGRRYASTALHLMKRMSKGSKDYIELKEDSNYLRYEEDLIKLFPQVVSRAADDPALRRYISKHSLVPDYAKLGTIQSCLDDYTSKCKARDSQAGVVSRLANTIFPRRNQEDRPRR